MVRIVYIRCSQWNHGTISLVVLSTESAEILGNMQPLVPDALSTFG
jgi:hypothetical protein